MISIKGLLVAPWNTVSTLYAKTRWMQRGTPFAVCVCINKQLATLPDMPRTIYAQPAMIPARIRKDRVLVNRYLPAAPTASRSSGKQVSAMYLHHPVAIASSNWQVLPLLCPIPAQLIAFIAITYKRKWYGRLLVMESGRRFVPTHARMAITAA